MLYYFGIIFIIIVALAILTFAYQTIKPIKINGSFGKKTLVTKHEQVMFSRLVQALNKNDYIVFVQVAMGALLVAKNGENRNKFSQKIVDFVVTDKYLNVIAIIELDDSSHNGREKLDEMRDAMLKSAGYKVLRYTRIPNVDQVLKDI